MSATSKARKQMVDTQIRTMDVTSYSVLQAFSDVPREKFVPESYRPFAYTDASIPISDRRTMTQPMPLSRLLQLADIKADNLVMIIASGSGYTAALASRLANTVVAVEQNEILAAQAEKSISGLGYDNVAVVTADLTEGVPSQGPYDVILIDGTVEDIPQSILDQLKDGGTLVTVTGSDYTTKAVKIIRTGDHFSSVAAFEASAPVLWQFKNEQGFHLS
ncbi:protein-L-isoaspartate O-methyltransferase [uncultured Cohaesibacter sp.]|uniref:protein-L-isoaspartate O-methyltransferase family protein n=1 Tax=uncultured Cohaesibacter sp. TaxID=1002546 RepID=UPI00292CC76E|nr:protein-L-isoaspartate O-methyltransferase [uncultured Cohaesibacter sp.]